MWHPFSPLLQRLAGAGGLCRVTSDQPGQHIFVMGGELASGFPQRDFRLLESKSDRQASR